MCRVVTGFVVSHSVVPSSTTVLSERRSLLSVAVPLPHSRPSSAPFPLAFRRAVSPTRPLPSVAVAIDDVNQTK